VSLIHSLAQQGYAIFVISINYHLISLLGSRLRIHQFSQKNLDEQPESYFEHFKNLNISMDELGKNGPEDILKQIPRIMELLSKPLPMVEVDEYVKTAKHGFQVERYFNDYLTCISDFYESFLMLSNYLLLLFQILDNKDVKKDLHNLVNGKKLPVHQLYSTKKKTQDERKLLRDYLSDCNLPVEHKQRLVTMCDHMFAKEGIRELRNKRIHHYGENTLKLVNGEYIEATYSTGRTIQYSLSNIHQEKVNLQFIVFIGYMVINSALYSIMRQLFQKEQDGDQGNKKLP